MQSYNCKSGSFAAITMLASISPRHSSILATKLGPRRLYQMELDEGEVAFDPLPQSDTNSEGYRKSASYPPEYHIAQGIHFT